MESAGRAYGAGMAGTAFDPVKLIKTPRFGVRLACAVFAIVVFGTISSRAWYTKADHRTVCVFGESDGTCTFSSGIGLLALIVCIIFGISDVMFDNVSGIHTRKKIVLADLASCGLFSFMWFIVFCVLANKWSWTILDEAALFVVTPCRAAITFSLFSMVGWIALTYFAWKRYKEGAEAAFAPSYEQDFSASPYNFPTGYGEEPYQSSFPTAGAGKMEYPTKPGYEQPPTSYQPPTY